MRLALAGETMLGRGVARELAKRAPQSAVSPEVAELTRAPDLCIVNLECCISERGEPVPRLFNFRAPPRAAETLAHLGVDCVLLANKHALDHGIEALLDTFAHHAKRRDTAQNAAALRSPSKDPGEHLARTRSVEAPLARARAGARSSPHA